MYKETYLHDNLLLSIPIYERPDPALEICGKNIVLCYASKPTFDRQRFGPEAT